jgi:signal transduction histidine kinase
MYYLIKQARKNFEDRSLVMLNTTLDIVRYSLKYAMMTGHPKDLQNVINGISLKEGIHHIRIYDKEGIIRYTSITDEINKNISVIGTRHTDAEHPGTKIISLESGDQIYSTTEPLNNDKLCQSCHTEKGTIAYLDIDTNLTSAETNFYTGSFHMIFLGWAVIFILITGLYFIFQKFINSPLQKLVLGLNEVESGNLNINLPVDRNDEIGIVKKHFNDMISKLKLSREKIEQMHMEELQRLDRLKTLGEMTSQTAHEVNNHIAIIMSRADYLSLESKKIAALQKYKEDFDMLVDQISKISTITGNILKYSRKSKLEKEKVDLIKVINDFSIIYKPLLANKNITLVTNFETKKAIITATAIHINQILSNLILNAADAIESNGTITIGLSKNDNDLIALTVHDDGPGISNDVQKEIFSPFFTTKSLKNNSGLGLYIIKKICENHSAEIKCESQHGSGSIFTITFKQ